MSYQPIVSDRVVCDDAKGTIKWIGLIPATKDLWFGVEWDDENRGKHDGSHNGIKYFDTRHSTSGSFVRPTRVTFGMSLEDAVRGRYQDDVTVEEELTAQLKRNIKARFVEVVGMEKIGKMQSQLDALQTVVLDGWPVNGGGVSNLQILLPRIRDLDLSNSLLSSWEEIARITEQLPTLKFLNVSGNILKVPENSISLIPATKHISHVVLNRMMTYTWNDLMTCALLFPEVKKIQLAYNQLESLGPILPGVFEQLEDIDVGANPLSDWKQICYLGSLPKLKIMNLNNCNLTLTEFPDTHPGEKTSLFPELFSLMIANNPLSYWDSTGELDKLLSLEELIISPEALEGRSNYFMEFTLARIRTLKILNRTRVTPREKRDHSIYYLKTFSDEYFSNGGSEIPDEAMLTSDFIRKHPTYMHLIKVHGVSTDERNFATQKSLKIRDIKLTLTLMAPQSKDQKEFTKNFLPMTRISKLKMMLKRLLKLNGSVNLKLSYIDCSKDEKQFEISLDNDMQDLHYYSVKSGDVLYIRW